MIWILFYDQLIGLQPPDFAEYIFLENEVQEFQNM